jgi:hypothetical protein
MMGRNHRRRLLLAGLWTGLALALSALSGCAAGPKQDILILPVQSAPGALAGATPVSLSANDKLLLQEAGKRLATARGPAVTAGSPAAAHVLTLYAVYARDQELTANIPYHSCMGPGFMEAQAAVQDMDAHRSNLEVSLVLTRDGEPLWQVRSQTRVKSSTEVVAFANLLVDRFLADWRAANP